MINDTFTPDYLEKFEPYFRAIVNNAWNAVEERIDLRSDRKSRDCFDRMIVCRDEFSFVLLFFSLFVCFFFFSLRKNFLRHYIIARLATANEKY